MADQTSVLRFIAEAVLPPDIDAIVRYMQRRETTKTFPRLRKQVMECVGRLLQNKLVQRCDVKRRVFGEPVIALYCLTDAGEAAVASGKRITSGPNKPLVAPRKSAASTFRARLWAAFRISKKATLPDLIELAREDRDADDVHSNALRYLTALVRAGVAARLPTREPGYAPSSPGFVRFALIRDLGPGAPIAAAKSLVDPNAEGDARFIPYGEKK
jgi:hypothetical protein